MFLPIYFTEVVLLAVATVAQSVLPASDSSRRECGVDARWLARAVKHLTEINVEVSK